MKKKISILMTAFLAVCLLVPATAVSASASSDPVDVAVNGKTIDFPEGYGQPFISAEGRTMVPLRGTAEAYGCTVDWDGETGQGIVRYGTRYAYVPVGSTEIRTDKGTVTMNTSARLIDNRIYIPVRYVMEAMGANVGWNGNLRLVTVNNPEEYTDPMEALTESLRERGSYRPPLGYVYSEKLPDDSGIEYRIIYNPELDRVRLCVEDDSPEGSGSYAYISVNGSYHGREMYISGADGSGADVSWSGSFDKSNYGNGDSYRVESSSVDSSQYGKRLTRVTVPQVSCAVKALNRYCIQHNLGVTAADFGFAE